MRGAGLSGRSLRSFSAENQITMKILNQYSKILLAAAFLMVAALLQNCKKEATAKTNTAPPTQGMYAIINDTAWTAAIVDASLSYDPTSSSRIFSCTGTMGGRIIQLVATQNNVAPANNFLVGDANNNLTNFFYYIQPIHRELTEQNPTAGKSAGTSLVITSIDTAKQLISGTFTFPQVDSAYDANYNFIFSQNNKIDNGFFKQVHYVYNK